MCLVVDREPLVVLAVDSPKTMAVDPHELLPRNKHDVASAHAIVALGYPANAPVLRDLLQWLQDGNWPVSSPMGDFLASIPEPMAPLIWEVLRGADYIWKYQCIFRLIGRMPGPVAEQFRAELMRLAKQPTPEEHQEELDEVAQEALKRLWPTDGA